MRIIAGRFKGRQLVSFKADHIRPTTDRVKESIFNILQGCFEDARVLDLYAGTGNLAFEALSRGATSVEMVELHPLSIKIIKDNIDHLKVREEVTVVKNDVLRYLKSYQGPAYNVILIDPPFTEKIAHSTMEHVIKSKVYDENSIIMIESSDHEQMEERYGNLVCYNSRDFGDKRVSFFRVETE